jgi:lipoprotein-anchoring transpeptidase ErfK/SrfK
MQVCEDSSLSRARRSDVGNDHSPGGTQEIGSSWEIAEGTEARPCANRGGHAPCRCFSIARTLARERLNGHYGEFTIKALALYRQSRGEQPSAPAKPDTAPDISGLDLTSFGPAFIVYTVTDADLQHIGPVPGATAAQAKLKFLPYRSAAEALAEKFHCDVHFLEQLNPGKTKTIKAGDQLNVPNVEPFELAAVKDLKPGSEIASLAANDLPDERDAGNNESTPAAKDKSSEAGAPATSVKIETKTNMLGVFEADKLVAAYPVTIGSAHTASPIGEWKVRQVVKLPGFRYDEEMLKHGRRSGNFHILPPGPRSPVGVIWIALNKKGIGLHGTNEPETIGRSVSHGCVRLSNWDVVRLAQKVKAGVPVSIQ